MNYTEQLAVVNEVREKVNSEIREIMTNAPTAVIQNFADAIQEKDTRVMIEKLTASPESFQLFLKIQPLEILLSQTNNDFRDVIIKEVQSRIDAAEAEGNNE
jgi:hypothetical protein